MSDGDIKSFDFAAEKTTKNSIIGSFKVRGETYDVRQLKDTVVPVLVRASAGGGQGMIPAVFAFLEKALTPESAKRFETDLLDPITGLTNDQVVQIFQHVLSMVSAGKATGASSESSAGSRTTGSASRGTSRARAAQNL